MFGKFKKSKSHVKDGEQKLVPLSKQQIQEKESYMQGIMQNNTLPIVVLDPSWYNIKALVQNPGLLKKEQLLMGFIKEQGELTHKLKEDGIIKQNLMKEVLKVSQKLGESDDKQHNAEMDKLQQAIVKLTAEIDAEEERLEQLGNLIKEKNKDILGEVVAIGYEYMEVCKSKSQVLEKEIDELRQTVLQKTADKKKQDEQINLFYHYLHNIVGYKHIDKVDKMLGD